VYDGGGGGDNQFICVLVADKTFFCPGTIMLNSLLLGNVWVKNFGKIYFSVLLLTVHT
jgi:hypothetical protein